MIQRTIEYIDYDGEVRKETFYFHLSRADIYRLEIQNDNSFTKKIQKLIDSQNQAEIWRIFENIVEMSVGKKSADGKRFDRSREAKADFLESEAYSEFIDMLMTGNHGKEPDFASDFINGLVSTADGNRRNNVQSFPAPTN